MKRIALVWFGTCLLFGLVASARVADPPVRTLGRVFEKLKAGQEVTIAYFGGSITAASGYRAKTFRWFQEAFPQATVKEVNAAIGGTGSDLGAFRCGADVIAKRPDLVVIGYRGCELVSVKIGGSGMLPLLWTVSRRLMDAQGAVNWKHECVRSRSKCAS